MSRSTKHKGEISVIRTVPGSTTLEPIIRRFCQAGEGVVTAYSDSALPLAKRFVDEDSSVDVLGFGELVMRVLRLCGEDAMPLAQSGHYESAIAYAAQELPDDSPFHRTVRFGGFHQALAKCLKELHGWGIDAEEMQRLASVASPRLASKLTSMAEVDREVANILSSLGRQTHAQQLRAALEATPERDGSFDRILVLAGSEEYPLRAEWLRWAASQGTRITVVVDRHAIEPTFFGGALRTVDQLGVNPVERGDGNLLTRNLFAREHTGGAKVEVEIFSMADPLAEAEWTLRACLAEESPTQCAIFVRDLEGYAPLLEASAKRLGVPLRIARRAPLLTNSFARLSLAALDFCAGRDVRNLTPVLKSSYLGLSGDDQSRAISALKEAHGQRDQAWEALQKWAFSAGAPFAWILSLLEWRHKAMSARYGLREWQSMLTGLLHDPKLPWSARRDSGRLTMTERDLRARNQLERLLANHVSIESVMADRSLGLAEMVAIAKRIWKEADVSIPSADFGILVTDQVDALSDAFRLHVMGMLEGVFPRRRTEDPILTDEERAEISALRPGKPTLSDSHQVALSERDVFYRVCAAAKAKLVLSYPQADDQRDNIPAFYLSEVRRAVGEVRAVDIPRLHLAPEEAKCLAAADTELRRSFDADREYPAALALTSAEARDTVRTPDGKAFEPRQLRDALECPFRYVARHRLRLDVHRPGERWNALARLPQAAGLLTQPNPASAEAALLVALDSELDRLYSEAEDWELQLLKSGGKRVIREWVQREMAARARWPKTPGSLLTQVPFGTGFLRSEMKQDVQLEGIVAGISRHLGYNIVHMYRGSVPDRIEDSEVETLYFGLHLMASFERGSGREYALEIDGVNGARMLLVLTRNGGTVNGDVAAGLTVKAISKQESSMEAHREFFGNVNKLMKKAVDVARRGTIDTLAGEHCGRCDFGELCRRSQKFGEDDSPFGRDLQRDGRLEDDLS